MWFRVFSTDEEAPEPAALLARLTEAGFSVQGDFGGEGRGWVRADFALGGQPAPVRLDRYLGDEEDVRDNLNAWAAWLETQDGNPYVHRLMQHMIGAQQVYAVEATRDEAEDEVGRFCVALCRAVAGATRGVYQVDGAGFFAPDGKLLVPEEP